MTTPEESAAQAYEAAGRLVRTGRLADAAMLLSPVLDALPVDRRSDAYGVIAGAALARGDGEGAVAAFAERAALTGSPYAAFDHAQALRGVGRLAEALDVLLPTLRAPRPNGRWFLVAGDMLAEAGRADEALQVWSVGEGIDPAVRVAWANPDADSATRAASRRADQAIRAHFSALHRQAAAASPRIAEAIWPQTHDGPLPRTDRGSRPGIFLVPGLPDESVFGGLDWMADLADAAPAIRAEWLANAGGARRAPYVTEGVSGEAWSHLRGQDAWSSVHVFQGGQPVQAEAFPETVKALEAVPVVRLNGNPIEAFFSVLAPGTAIPPHHGLSNTRLTVHLPLIVPGDGTAAACAIRVGGHVHPWTEGEVFAFDDSHEHEAWNRTDEARVVLIFEAWRPELTDVERAAVEASFSARQAWLDARTLPTSSGTGPG